jgi:hypothetical protein
MPISRAVCYGDNFLSSGIMACHEFVLDCGAHVDYFRPLAIVRVRSWLHFVPFSATIHRWTKSEPSP